LFLGVATGFDTIFQKTKKNLVTIVTTTANQLYYTTIVVASIKKT